MTGSSPLATVLLFAALALAPFLLVTLTSFAKIAVSLVLLRQAIGAREAPPTIVITGLALLLSVVVMAPVAGEIYRAVEPELRAAAPAPAATIAAAAKAREPVRAFLARHAHARDRAVFTDVARRLARPEDRAAISDADLSVLAPAFVTSELKEAFGIGFLLFIPFLVIDFLVASVLSAVGLAGVAPQSVSVPFKLLLFVVVDGWLLIARGLLVSYA